MYMNMEPRLSLRQRAWQGLKQFMLTQPNALTFIIMIGAGLALSFLYLSRNFVDPPPFRYEQAIVSPVDSTLCPGEVLEYDVTFRITEAPVVLVTTRTWFHVDGGDIGLFDESPDWSGHNEPEIITGNRRFIVPMLVNKPGKWEFRVVVESLQSDASGYVVPFTISPECFT